VVFTLPHRPSIYVNSFTFELALRRTQYNLTGVPSACASPCSRPIERTQKPFIYISSPDTTGSNKNQTWGVRLALSPRNSAYVAVFAAPLIGGGVLYVLAAALYGTWQRRRAQAAEITPPPPTARAPLLGTARRTTEAAAAAPAETPTDRGRKHTPADPEASPSSGNTGRAPPAAAAAAAARSSVGAATAAPRNQRSTARRAAAAAATRGADEAGPAAPPPAYADISQHAPPADAPPAGQPPTYREK
jgi:hypothetical protein